MDKSSSSETSQTDWPRLKAKPDTDIRLTTDAAHNARELVFEI